MGKLFHPLIRFDAKTAPAIILCLIRRNYYLAIEVGRFLAQKAKITIDRNYSRPILLVEHE